jgi:hypothetical protein
MPSPLWLVQDTEGDAYVATVIKGRVGRLRPVNGSPLLLAVAITGAQMFKTESCTPIGPGTSLRTASQVMNVAGLMRREHGLKQTMGAMQRAGMLS